MTPSIFYGNLFSESVIHTILFLYISQFINEMMIIEQIIMNKIRMSKITQEKEWLLKPISTRLIISLIKFQKWTCLLFPKSTWLKTPNNDRLILVQQDMYVPRKMMFHLQRNVWRKYIHGELINLQGIKC
jgi:hypothetical protein